MSQPIQGRILALDLGRRRIGLAVSDQLGVTAQGLPTLERSNMREDLERLTRLATERGVGSILIGNPVRMNGSEGAGSAWVREFAGRLERHSGYRVTLWDERLTTVEASRVLRESGISREKRGRAVDRLAAVILLQSYLESCSAAASGDEGG
ncbi:MAG TPA: Holliday junction resolvase RuvX [Bryobacteraceae bacterium]|nr:Holliday junction resolvase RuvX [Bryobacteraceae bacterium]